MSNTFEKRSGVHVERKGETIVLVRKNNQYYIVDTDNIHVYIYIYSSQKAFRRGLNSVEWMEIKRSRRQYNSVIMCIRSKI